MMGRALNATGRPVLYSLCGWNHWSAAMAGALLSLVADHCVKGRVIFPAARHFQSWKLMIVANEVPRPPREDKMFFNAKRHPSRRHAPRGARRVAARRASWIGSWRHHRIGNGGGSSAANKSAGWLGLCGSGEARSDVAKVACRDVRTQA